MRLKQVDRGSLFTLSGPSGSGKSSLCRALLDSEPNLSLSISCTTRSKRSGETEGNDYHFIGEGQFQTLISERAFLEYASVHGNMYGTRSEDVEIELARGHSVLLEIDWQGARQVAEKSPDLCRIFILPPSIEELRHRLQLRGQDSIEVIERRLAAAHKEISHANEAEFLIINSDFNHSLEDLRAITHAHRLRLPLVTEPA